MSGMRSFMFVKIVGRFIGLGGSGGRCLELIGS